MVLVGWVLEIVGMREKLGLPTMYGDVGMKAFIVLTPKTLRLN